MSIKKHPLWDEFKDRTMNLTGYYEDDSFLYLAEEAHRRDGALIRIEKSALTEALDKINADPSEDLDGTKWDPVFEDDLMEYLDRIV